METIKESIIRKQKVEEENFEGFAESKGIKRYAYTPLEHPYDVNFLSGNTWCIGEIKVRVDKSINFFETYGPFLELTKIEGMYKKKLELESKYNRKITMLYINYTFDGLQIFYLNEPWTYKFEWKELPANNYDNTKKWKMVASLKNATETIRK
jgi:hypothetical protein